jgi:hypothetical protein
MTKVHLNLNPSRDYLRRPLRLFLVYTGLALATSCHSDRSEGPAEPAGKPASSGSHAELLLLVEDSHWEGPIGETLKRTFARPFPGLLQSESLFNTIPVNPKAVTGLLKRTKSIVIIEVQDSAYFRVERNLWAQPQIVAIIAGPENTIRQTLRDRRQELIDLFREHDIQLIQRRMAKSSVKNLPQPLLNMGIQKMTLPKGLQLTTHNDTVAVFWQRGMKTDQGLLVYSRVLRDEVLPGQDVIAVRDSICKYYIPGAIEGAYMGTETEITPIQKIVPIGNHFAIETRGNWTSINDRMGGPFISYTIYLDEQDRIVTLDAWFYGPSVKKRNFLLEMEAYMRSVQFN